MLFCYQRYFNIINCNSYVKLRTDNFRHGAIDDDGYLEPRIAWWNLIIHMTLPIIINPHYPVVIQHCYWKYNSSRWFNYSKTMIFHSFPFKNGDVRYGNHQVGHPRNICFIPEDHRCIDGLVRTTSHMGHGHIHHTQPGND